MSGINTVEPIRDRAKITEILEGLERDTTVHGKRMYLLFATMYFTGLRICDIIKLEKRHVKGRVIHITEQKTGKLQNIVIANDLKTIFDTRLNDLKDNDYLFKSRKHNPDGTERHITTRDAAYDMAIIKRRFALNFPFSCHSLRKTHGYIRYKYYGDSIEILRLHFNHADEITTRRYIGIDEEERNKSLIKLHAGEYQPQKADKYIRRINDSDELIINRLDRSENGKKWGEQKREAAKRKQAMKEREKLKAERKKEYDHKRYLQKKTEKELV